MKSILIFLLLAGVACAGSAGLTKTEYIAQANAICATVNSESDRISDQITAEITGLGDELTVE